MKRRKVVSFFVVVALVLTLLSSSVMAAPSSWVWGKTKVKEKCFSDVGESFKWAEKAINKMNRKGIIIGIGNGLFQPNKPVTHLEAVIMTLRLLDKEDEVSKVDIIPSQIKKIPVLWIYGLNYLKIADDIKIITKDEFKTFNPNQPAKRWEVAKYIVRALGEDKDFSRTKIESMKRELKDKFKDANSIPEEAIGYVYTALDLGIMTGYSNGNFMPNKPVTRSEMAVLIERADNLDATDKKDSEVIGVVDSVDVRRMRIKVDGKYYDVSDDAEVYDEKEKEIDIDEIAAGDTVRMQLDKNNEVIFIELLDEVWVRATIKKLYSNKLEITLQNGKTKTLIYGDKIKVYIENSGKQVKDLAVGDYGRFKYLGDTLLEVRITERAEAQKFEVKGLIKGLTFGNSPKIKLDNGKTYDVSKDVDVEIDGEEAEFKELKIGYEVKIKGSANVVTDIEARTEEIEDFEVKGFITDIDKVGVLWITIAGKPYKVDPNVRVKINSRTRTFEDLQKGYYAKIQGKDDVITKIEATTPENLTLEFEGKIKTITRTVDKVTLTIEDASKNEYIYEVSDEVRLKGDIDELNELRPGYRVKLKVEYGKIVEIEVK